MSYSPPETLEECVAQAYRIGRQSGRADLLMELTDCFCKGHDVREFILAKRDEIIRYSESTEKEADHESVPSGAK